MSNLSFEGWKAAAPQILGELTRQLKVFHQEDLEVPCEVKNLLDFSWEEIVVFTKRRPNFGSLKNRLTFTTDFTVTADPSDQEPKINNEKIIPSESHRLHFWSYRELRKFRGKTKKLLNQIQKLKIENVTTLIVDQQQSLPPIIISSCLQLVPELTGCCLSYSLSSKYDHITNNSSQYDYADDILESRHYTKEMLQAAMKDINKGKSTLIAKGLTKAMVFQTYTKTTTCHSTGKPGSNFNSKSTKSMKNIRMPKMIRAMPDGTMFIYYPSGHVAICQLTFLMGIPYTFHFCYEDAPSLACLACFISNSHGFVYYNEPYCCSVALVWDTFGGVIRDIKGYVVHKWVWLVEDPPFKPFEFQINEHLKLRVLSQRAITLLFSFQEDSISVPLLSPSLADHLPKKSKLVTELLNEELEKQEPLYRAMLELKRQFQHCMKRFTREILIAAGKGGSSSTGISNYSSVTKSPCVKYKTVNKSYIPDATKITILSPIGSLNEPTAVWTTQLKSPKVAVRTKPVQESSTKAPNAPLLPAPTHCPVLLRKWLMGVFPGSKCKCLTKAPYVTDLELDMFIKASQASPQLILVLGIMSSRQPQCSAILQQIFDELYEERNYFISSPCLQAAMDTYRLVMYDVDSPYNQGPAMLVERNSATPGMALMYNKGRLIFGGTVFNGYGCSKKDLLEHIRQKRWNCSDREFLPDSFKFSQGSPTRSCLDIKSNTEKQSDLERTLLSGEDLLSP